MTSDGHSDETIRRILETVRTVAIVGASANSVRPSWFVLKYMIQKGYTVFPVNPGQAGREILGRPVHACLADIPEPIDMVDVFRAAEAVPGIVEEALALSPRPKVIWMQLGIRHEEAAARAAAEGLEVVMNRCPKIEYGRLSGEIAWAGVASRQISARRPVRAAGFQRLSIGGKAPGSAD